LRTILFILTLLLCLSIFSQGVVVNAGYFIVQPSTNVVITGNGNWTNNATATLNIGSWVRFSGNAIQRIQGTNTTAFSNLDANNSTSVFVQRDISINTSLQLTLGYFDLRGAITTLGNTASVTGGETETKRLRSTSNAGGTDDGYGIGTVRTTRVNPTGNVANLGLDFTPAAALGNTLLIRGHLRQAGSGSFTGNYSIFRYYEIQPTVQSNLTINAHNYLHAELNGHTEANLQMYQWFNGGGPNFWTPRAGTINTVANTANSTTQTNVLTFYKVTLGSITIPLPVELLNFSAKCDNPSIEINWQTASELNNDYFTVEKSPDGLNFTPLTMIPSRGNSSEIVEYSTFDFSPFSGNNYYRLLQTDLDGTETYFELITVNCSQENIVEDILPVSPSVYNVDAIVRGKSGSNYTIVLTDVLGQIISSKNIILSGSQETVNVYENILATGVYFLTMRSAENQISKQIVIGF